MYEVKSKQEAVEWTSRFMQLHREHRKGSMRPTVYVPLAEIRRTGLRRAGATMAARFIAGRIATPGPLADDEQVRPATDADANHTTADDRDAA